MRMLVSDHTVYDIMLKSVTKHSSVPNSKGKSSTLQKSFDLNHRSDKKSKPMNY